MRVNYSNKSCDSKSMFVEWVTAQSWTNWSPLVSTSPALYLTWLRRRFSISPSLTSIIAAFTWNWWVRFLIKGYSVFKFCGVKYIKISLRYCYLWLTETNATAPMSENVIPSGLLFKYPKKFYTKQNLTLQSSESNSPKI